MKPLDPRDAWTLFSPDASSALELPRWMHAARTFLSAELSSHGASPLGEHLVGVAPARDVSKVTIVRMRTFSLVDAPSLRDAAGEGLRAIGGAGMDALVAKALRVWQIDRNVEGDARAPLVLAATLAAVMLAPIVPPDEVTIYGVRGARVRLDRLGWV